MKNISGSRLDLLPGIGKAQIDKFLICLFAVCPASRLLEGIFRPGTAHSSGPVILSASLPRLSALQHLLYLIIHVLI